MLTGSTLLGSRRSGVTSLECDEYEAAEARNAYGGRR